MHTNCTLQWLAKPYLSLWHLCICIRVQRLLFNELRKVQVNQVKIYMMSMEFTIHPALWDATYVCGKMVATYLTSQSDNMDTSPGARLFNTWRTAMQMAICSKLNTWKTWFAGEEIQCGSGCLHTCWFVSRTRRAYRTN